MYTELYLTTCESRNSFHSVVGDALVAKLKTETVNFLVRSYRMEEPKNLRDAWKQKHEVPLLMNAICEKDLSRTSRTSRTSMMKNSE